MGGGQRSPGTGEGVWLGLRAHSEAPSRQPLFPASGRKSLPRPIGARRAGRGRQEARGLVERLSAPGHAGSSGGRSAGESESEPEPGSPALGG